MTKKITKKTSTKTVPKRTKPIGKILIVEDELTLLKALNEKFTRHGFLVTTAVNGKTGLKSALKNKPDLILLDILMPVMDGMTMLKELRKDKWGATVFVIMLTNKEPDFSLLDETEKVPYRSCYLMKSDYDIMEIVEFAKSKLKPHHLT